MISEKTLKRCSRVKLIEKILQRDQTIVRYNGEIVKQDWIISNIKRRLKKLSKEIAYLHDHLWSK